MCEEQPMWKSVIYDAPEPDIGWNELNPQWPRWLETVTQEPWYVALCELVKWSGTWTGTEEELVENISRRVSREVRDSEDFPSTYQKLLDYYRIIFPCVNPAYLPNLLDYRELKKRDLEAFDVPGWGPEAPILVEWDSAGTKPQYWETLYVLLDRYCDPLSIAILDFTHSSRKFTKKNRIWTGFTTKLAKQLLVYCPIPGTPSGHSPPLPRIPDDQEREDFEQLSGETFKLLDLRWYSDYQEFAGRMRTCAYILREFGIKVSCEKISYTEPDSEGKRRKKHKLYWTIEAPRWRW